MSFSEWFAEVTSILHQKGKKRISMSRDDFSVVIADYWDGVSPEEQAKRLVTRG